MVELWFAAAHWAMISWICWCLQSPVSYAVHFKNVIPVMSCLTKARFFARQQVLISYSRFTLAVRISMFRRVFVLFSRVRKLVNFAI